MNADPRSPAPAADEATALVVDDDANMRGILRHVLEMEGWVVEEAADGKEALQAFRAHPPDLVLTDLEMPRMTGEELARRIRDEAEENGGVPMLAISRREPREETRELFDAVLRKPVALDQLRDWLQR
jgi:CheY-like chemotaxis protein